MSSGAQLAFLAAATAANPSTAGPSAAGPSADVSWADWDAIRAASDIQYAPVKPVPPPQSPALLEALGKFLRELFEPLGRAIGVSWPVIQNVLIALAALGVLVIVWRIAAPLIGRRRSAKVEADPGWQPLREAALALLDDADKLAAAGRFAEAVHLLLQRSVGQIAAARPDWLHPASTAREIAALPPLPAAARTAFGEISTRVERSRYALRDLDAADWRAARAAYAAFALERLPT